MSGSNMDNTSTTLLEEIVDFVAQASGLRFQMSEGGYVFIAQTLDQKTFAFQFANVTEVLSRTDVDGKAFIQVNFHDGKKVLLTDTLIGFKPAEIVGLDMSKIPKVVTTPDLTSVFEALEETMSGDRVNDHEVEILKKVYQSILVGGEDAGFELKSERDWLDRLLASKFRASA